MSAGTAMPPQDVAGDYPYGVTGKLGAWDGEAWTGKTEDADNPPLHPWHHRFLIFLGHRWWWLMVAGSVLVAIPGFLQAVTGQQWWGYLTAPGYAVVMVGLVALVDQHVRMTPTPVLWTLVAWGVVAGAVGFGVGFLVEDGVLNLTSQTVVLWLAGPIEETAKLLVPVALLVFAASRFGDPRRGLLLALVSGATFGLMEGVKYVVQGGDLQPALMALARPSTELLHPLLTGFAAAVIWLAAHRAGRALTTAGVVAWLVAAAIHSVHDGMLAPFTNQQTTIKRWDEVVVGGTTGILFGVLWAVVLYLLLRHTARELVPPEAVPANPPHWRPRLAQWGVPHNEATDAWSTAGSGPAR